MSRGLRRSCVERSSPDVGVHIGRKHCGRGRPPHGSLTHATGRQLKQPPACAEAGRETSRGSSAVQCSVVVWSGTFRQAVQVFLIHWLFGCLVEWFFGGRLVDWLTLIAAHCRRPSFQVITYDRDQILPCHSPRTRHVLLACTERATSSRRVSPPGSLKPSVPGAAPGFQTLQAQTLLTDHDRHLGRQDGECIDCIEQCSGTCAPSRPHQTRLRRDQKTLDIGRAIHNARRLSFRVSERTGKSFDTTY